MAKRRKNKKSGCSDVIAWLLVGGVIISIVQEIAPFIMLTIAIIIALLLIIGIIFIIITAVNALSKFRKTTNTQRRLYIVIYKPLSDGEYFYTNQDTLQRLNTSLITQLPNRFDINGIIYDLDSPSDIENMPAFTLPFYINGKKWYINNYLRLYAKAHKKCGNKELSLALKTKASLSEQCGLRRVSKFFILSPREYVSPENASFACRNIEIDFPGALESQLQNGADSNLKYGVRYYVKQQLDFIDSMDGYDFEEYIAQLLRDIGYGNVTTTKKTGDQGIDVIAYDTEHKKYGIQCKRSQSKIGNKAVQEVFMGKTLYHCDFAMIITNNYFTPSAVEAAKGTGIILWDRSDLTRFVRQRVSNS